MEQLRKTYSSAASGEAAARQELAACYRLFHWLGWTELIFNHITLRLPSRKGRTRYLINRFGLHYSEVTPENLVCVDDRGIDTESDVPVVNPAGFIIHGALHRARADAHCIMHVHTTAGCAVACKEEGLRYDNFYSALLHGDVAYHDYEGVVTRPEEQSRLVHSLGQKDHLILRNHGLLTVGADVPGAFMRLWILQRACEVQLACDAANGPNRAIPAAVLEGVSETRIAGRAAMDRQVFLAMVRCAGIDMSHPA